MLKLFFLLAIIFIGQKSLADQADNKAVMMHVRLTGIVPSSTTQQEMAVQIRLGNLQAAAKVAMQTPAFYSSWLKKWLTPFSNEAQSALLPLNDMTATLIGMIRDNVPFNQIFYGDIVYIGNEQVPIPYSRGTNAHYEAMEKSWTDLKATLIRRRQTDFPWKDRQGNLIDISQSFAAAGVLTSRSFGAHFLHAGTNRAAVEAIMGNFFCTTMEDAFDTRLPDFRVRRDVPRFPAGDPKTFKSKCVGCHSFMDGLAGAFAYHDFIYFPSDIGEVIYTKGKVAPKYNQNSEEFPQGFVTTDDSWINLLNMLQIEKNNQGKGLHHFGRFLSMQQEFSVCMAKRSFKQVCQSEPSIEQSLYLVDKFVNSDNSMQVLLAESAALCFADPSGGRP